MPDMLPTQDFAVCDEEDGEFCCCGGLYECDDECQQDSTHGSILREDSFLYMNDQ